MIDGVILSKIYHPNDFNCGHFFVWAWNILFPDKKIYPNGSDHSLALLGIKSNFKKTSELKEFGAVTMHHLSKIPHLGIFYKGKVLHIRQGGPEYQPLDVAMIGYQEVRFYEFIK